MNDLATLTPPFALLHREGTNRVEVLRGDVAEVDSLSDLPGHDLLVLIPFCQVRERGFDCWQDGAPLLAMRVLERFDSSVAEAREYLPRDAVRLRGGGFDLDDEAYADVVRAIVAAEIGAGLGANFVIKRTFSAVVADWSPRAALALFAWLLAAEQGSYWTFVVHTGTDVFVGASPERHVSVDDGTVVMNPISGTYRYPGTGPTLEGVLSFLADQKETDELRMVLDEELKMMAKICPEGGYAIGPRLREMAHLAHTEYLLSGRSELDVRDILRQTMFAPTVTGSPLQSAFRVIKRYEAAGRGHYGGVLALIDRDEAGRQQMDSAILIRTAEIDADGRLRLSVGATLVRHSDPAAEVAETHAKLEGMLSAFGSVRAGDGAGSADRAHTSRGGGMTGIGREVGSFRTDVDGIRADAPPIREALSRRNLDLARFWLQEPGARGYAEPEFSGRTVLLIDAEDDFTAMLAHQLRALGLTVTMRRCGPAVRPDDHDLVILGPGPGDPQDRADPRIGSLHSMAAQLLRDHHPFLAVCLSHQVVCSLLGLPVTARASSAQGRQKKIDYFGESRTVGFYNTFSAFSDRDTLSGPLIPAGVRVSRDRRTGEVHALHGEGFCTTQFHSESVLSSDGLDVLREQLFRVLQGGQSVAADVPASQPNVRA